MASNSTDAGFVPDDDIFGSGEREVIDFSNRESAISVRNVCIDYRTIHAASIKDTLFNPDRKSSEIFHAVKNVSFEVPEGQILGITGKNGSGKSTMLRAIAGIFSADSGEIDLLETEIMLIDEVLSVGDQKFRKKSYNKMKDLISKRDRTVVIVSHSMSTLKDLCDQIIWLHGGEIIMYDTPDVVLPIYEDFMK